MIHHGLMRPWSARSLTAGEAALCKEALGGQLRLDRVRLWSCPPLAWSTGRPFCAGGWLWPGRTLIVYPPAQAHEDFALAPMWDQSVFVHEATHAWQSQQGVNLLWAKLRAGDGEAAYAYDLGPDRTWDGFNIEQQAMLVQHAFLRRRGRGAPYEEAAYLAVLPFTGSPPELERAASGKALAASSASPT